MRSEAVAAARATLRAAGVPVVDDPGSTGIPEFFLSLGEMGALIAVRDWSATPLGPPSGWPAELWAAIETCLPSKIPMLVWWGPELVQLYNDAYVKFLGAKQPRGLGEPGAECWADVWDDVGPLAEGVLAGRGAVYRQELPLLMERHGYPEETYWTFSYSPIHDHSGAIRGIFVATSDVTARVLTDRRMRTLRDLGQVSALDAGSVEGVLATTVEVLAGCCADLPFVAAYWLDGEEPVAECGEVRAAPALTAAATQVVRDGRTLLVDDRAAGAAAAHPHTAVVLPIVAGGQCGALALGVSPLRVLDDDYRAFLDLVAARTSAMCTEVVTHQAERSRAEREAVLARFTARLSASDDAASMLEVGLDELRAAADAPGAAGLATTVEETVAVRGVLPPDVPTDASGLRRLVAAAIGRGALEPATGGLVLAPASGPGPLPLVAWVGPLPSPPAEVDRALIALLAERLAEGLRRVRAQERVAALAAVAVAVSGAATAEQVTDLILEQGLAALGADGGAVAVLEDDGVLRATITESLGARTVAVYGRFPLGGPLPAAVAAATGERVLLPDRAASLAFAPEMADVLADTGCQAWASLPLRGGDKSVVGSLSVGWVRPHDFPPRQVELLDAFAAHCAQGLDRIATREAERAVATATRRLAETLQRSLLTERCSPTTSRSRCATGRPRATPRSAGTATTPSSTPRKS
jgi:GAF domain-containing protein